MIDWIIASQQPWRVVEETSFKELLKNLNPLFKIPTAKTISNYMDIIYDEQKKKVQQYLRNLSNKISLTTDGWTSMTQESFLSITGKNLSLVLH